MHFTATMKYSFNKLSCTVISHHLQEEVGSAVGLGDQAKYVSVEGFSTIEQKAYQKQAKKVN